MAGIILFYLRLLFSSSPKETSDHAIAGWCLLNKSSFRLSSSASTDRLIGFRVWLKVTKSLLKIKSAGIEKRSDGKAGVGLFDNRKAVKDIRLNHIRSNHADVPAAIFFREDLSSGHDSKRFGDAFLLFLLMPTVAAWCFFSSRRVNIALLFDELAEAAQLQRFVRKEKITTLYFFSPFEKDANALYLLLKKNGIAVSKIPSPNLLSIHHRHLLSDVLILSSPYQQDELQHFSKTIRVNTIQHWLPEQYFSYGDVYEYYPEPKRGTIGYYSHATWVRQQEDHADTGAGDHESEEALLKVLSVFMKKNPGFQLTIFLHPREKKHPDFAEVEKHYSAYFRKEDFQFAERTISSARLFHTVDTGIGAISTILFERLFTGYKTIFYPAGMTAFPVTGSDMNKICVTDGESLEKLILESAPLENSDYFRASGLAKYTRMEWIKQ
jgi:hypothetical protein